MSAFRPSLVQRRPKRQQQSSRRPDIQGLRAVAVLAVVLDHLCHWPSGGFVGVDIFFVISGFLITGLLVREWEKTDRISWSHFYVRRVKRIIPAAVVTLAMSVIAARLLLTAERGSSITTDAIWSLFFVGNWRFASTGTDYFQQAADPSPLQHFWSLGVEEQFYFVWPWVMLAILLVLLKLDVPNRFDRRVIAVVMLAIIAGSFVFAMSESASNATVAYFSTFSRAWELGIGALLAVVAPWLNRSIPLLTRTVIVWLGLAGIIASLFVIDSTLQFPAPWAALPVLATALVIAGSTGAAASYLGVLTNPAAVYVGNLSYSLYLWHFPVIVLVGSQFDHRGGWQYYVVLCAAIALLSVVSFHAIEDPLNNSPLWTGKHDDGHKRMLAAQWRENYGPRAAAFGLAGIVGVTGGMVWLAASATASSGPAPIEVSAPTKDDSGAALSRTATKLQEELAATLATPTWPTLPKATGATAVHDQCADVDPSDPSSCSFGNPSKPQIVIFGDSLAGALLPTVREAYGDRYRIRDLTKAACPTNGYEIKFGSFNKGKCQRFIDDSIAYINKTAPDMVFLINNYAWTQSTYTAVGESADTSTERWRSADEGLVKRLSKSGTEVVIVGSQSEGRFLSDCKKKNSSPADCVSSIRDYWKPIHDVEKSIEGVTFIDTQKWWCVRGKCPSFAAGMYVRVDQIHPTEAWAKHVAADFKAMVDSQVLEHGRDVGSSTHART